MNDPRELGIPNISFGYAGDDHRDAELFKKQRLERGFDDSETWGLDTVIARFIVPRLERFLEIAPEVVNIEEYRKDIDLALAAFKLVAEDRVEAKEDIELINKGLESFTKIYRKLWW